MNKTMFSCGQELGNIVVSSGILQHSWDAVQKLESLFFCSSSSLIYKSFQHPNCTIIAFATSSPSIQNVRKDLVSSSEQDLKIFDFLCTQDNPSFSLNKAAVDIFMSNYGDLMNLKSQVVNSNRFVITGKSLAGSVAALFTFLLLNTFDPGSKDPKLPFCVTFGSPLIGDGGLQEIISKSSPWDSCFLHVVSHNDPVPKIFIPADTKASAYMPFGTFLFCSDLGCACFDDPEAVLELLMKTSPLSGESHEYSYTDIIKRLEQMVCFKDNYELTDTDEWVINPQTSIVAQIKATGIEVNMEELITKMEKKFLFQKFKAFEITAKANDRLNDIKINMAHLEWYKKKAKNGYYDSFKYKTARRDHDVVIIKNKLNEYWKEIVAEAQRMPQAFMTRYVYGGTNYRRMVEPLDIAEYYRAGKRNYLTEGRNSEEYKHYISLEQMIKEPKKKCPKIKSYRKKQYVSSILTEDSCFWAHVEDAIILCDTLKSGQVNANDKERSWGKLVEFEEYVMSLIKNYAVNPEIFLKDSSFMKWWKEYEPIAGNSSDLSHLSLTNFMKSDYEKYTVGAY